MFYVNDHDYDKSYGPFETRDVAVEYAAECGLWVECVGESSRYDVKAPSAVGLEAALYAANSVNDLIAQWSPAQATRSVAVFRFNNGSMIHTELYVDCKAYEPARDWLEQTMGCEVTYRGWMSNCTVCDLILS